MWTMWASATEKCFLHPEVNKEHAQLYAGRGAPLVQVEVTEDPKGTYFGWVDLEKGSEVPTLIWPSLAQLKMCFPCGTKDAVARGEGRIIQLSVVAKTAGGTP